MRTSIWSESRNAGWRREFTVDRFQSRNSEIERTPIKRCFDTCRREPFLKNVGKPNDYAPLICTAEKSASSGTVTIRSEGSTAMQTSDSLFVRMSTQESVSSTSPEENNAVMLVMRRRRVWLGRRMAGNQHDSLRSKSLIRFTI
jgi:hypothetical protein